MRGATVAQNPAGCLHLSLCPQFLRNMAFSGPQVGFASLLQPGVAARQYLQSAKQDAHGEVELASARQAFPEGKSGDGPALERCEARKRCNHYPHTMIQENFTTHAILQPKECCIKQGEGDELIQRYYNPYVDTTTKSVYTATERWIAQQRGILQLDPVELPIGYVHFSGLVVRNWSHVGFQNRLLLAACRTHEKHSIWISVRLSAQVVGYVYRKGCSHSDSPRKNYRKMH